LTDRDADFELVQRAQRGDKRAFGLLVNKYQRKISRLLARMIRESADVDDVVQDAFIKAYRALPSFRGESAFYTWLYRIAINTAKNHFAALGRRGESLSIDADDGEGGEGGPVISDVATPEAEIQSRQLAHAVNQAMEALPEELRSAIVLRELEGLSYEEIAEAMNCPVGTVRSRIFRAREAIALQLRPLLDSNGERRWS
jgi:RNA polymerase sigma-70 factor (ECF subfamily)